MNKQTIQKEIEHIAYLLNLKKVTRFGFARPQHDPTESVAEHVYGLMVLAKYFLPLVDAEKGMNHQLIYDMILWHDTGEIETGDVPMFLKTQQDMDAEVDALGKVKKSAPQQLADEIYNAAYHYETGDSQERRFMKAIDKLESAFSLYCSLDTALERFAKQKVTYQMFIDARTQSCGPFPLLLEFALRIGEQLNQHKVFYEQDS